MVSMLTCYDIRLLLPHGIILIVIYHYPGKMSIAIGDLFRFIQALSATYSSTFCRETSAFKSGVFGKRLRSVPSTV